MKKVRFCFEVRGMAIDECGNPAPAGMQFTIGEVTDEEYASIDYFEVMKGVNVIDCLNSLGLEQFASKDTEADFRLISPEEYDREYGDDEEATQAGEGGSHLYPERK